MTIAEASVPQVR